MVTRINIVGTPPKTITYYNKTYRIYGIYNEQPTVENVVLTLDRNKYAAIIGKSYSKKNDTIPQHYLIYYRKKLKHEK